MPSVAVLYSMHSCMHVFWNLNFDSDSHLIGSHLVGIWQEVPIWPLLNWTGGLNLCPILSTPFVFQAHHGSMIDLKMFILEAGELTNLVPLYVVLMILAQIHIQCANSHLSTEDMYTMDAPIFQPQQLITPSVTSSLLGQKEKVGVGNGLKAKCQNPVHLNCTFGIRSIGKLH